MRADLPDLGLGLLLPHRSRRSSWEVGFAWSARGLQLVSVTAACTPSPSPIAHRPLCDLSRHLTYVLSSIQFLNMRHVTHTLHIARCTLRSPPSCKRAEWRVRVRVHAVRCRSCPRCALHVYMSTELVCFPVLTCCSLTRAASNVCYRIAAISHGLPFCFLFRFV